MKRIVELEEKGGLETLLGERVLLMCAGYFYEGKLIEIGNDYVKLNDPSVVYETGPWSDNCYKDIQKMYIKEWFVKTALIESFGKSKNV